MKKIILISTAILLSVSLISCESTKNTSSAQKINIVDQNDNEIETIESSEDEVYESEDYDATSETDSDEYDDGEENSSKKDKKSIISWGNTDKFLLAEDTSVFSPNAVMKYKQKAATITIDPETGSAGFGAPYMLAYYVILFDSKSADKFNKALNFYLADFENKKLERNSKKSAKKYGSEEIDLYWGTIKTSTPNNARAKCHFGYEFYEGSPYFTICVPPVLNNLFLNGNATADQYNLNIKYYLTKAQAKKLAECIAPEYVNPIILAHNKAIMGGDAQDADEY